MRAISPVVTALVTLVLAAAMAQAAPLKNAKDTLPVPLPASPSFAGSGCRSLTHSRARRRPPSRDLSLAT